MSARRQWAFAGAGVVLLVLAIALFKLTRDGDEKPPLRSTVTYDAPLQTPADAAIDAMIAIDAAVDGSVGVSSPRAREEREALLASLRDSGEGHEGWEGQANELFKSIANRDTQVSDIGCFIAGCGATFTFSSQMIYQQQIGTLEGSTAYAAWTGGKRFSPPEIRPDGRVVVALVVYRPD